MPGVRLVHLGRTGLVHDVLDSAATGVAVLVGDFDAESVTDQTPFVLGEDLFRPVTAGFRVGDDARDVYREALRRGRGSLLAWNRS